MLSVGNIQALANSKWRAAAVLPRLVANKYNSLWYGLHKYGVVHDAIAARLGLIRPDHQYSFPLQLFRVHRLTKGSKQQDATTNLRGRNDN